MKRLLCFFGLFLWVAALPGLDSGLNSAQAVFVGRPSALKCNEEFAGSRRIASVALRHMTGSGNYTITLARDEADSQGANLAVPQVGVAIEVVRCLPPGHHVKIASGKIEKVNDGYYLANVFVPSSVVLMDSAVATQTLVMNKNLYWQPMEGDTVRIVSPEVVRKQKLWPRFEFEVGEIFETRDGDEAAYLTLSNQGRKKLVESFEQLANFDGRFLIEAWSNGSGDSAALQELTQIRAGTVANFLARVFEMEPSRLVSMGKGREQFASTFVPIAKFRSLQDRSRALSVDGVSIRVFRD